MASNPIQGPAYLDPIFPIPEGLVDYQYSEQKDGVISDYLLEEGYSNLEGEYDIEDDAYLFDDGEEEQPEEIETPNSLVIVPPQIIRTQPSGMQVVDLVVEVEDVPGATNYEFRVVKL